MFIFNKSWLAGEVSIGWKKARALPLFKEGKWAALSNYEAVRWAFNQYVFDSTKCKVIYPGIMNGASTGSRDLIPSSSRRILSRAGENLSLWHGGIRVGMLLAWFRVCSSWGPLEIEGIQGKFTRMTKDFAIHHMKLESAQATEERFYLTLFQSSWASWF